MGIGWLQAKGVQDSATAAVRVSGLELGGLIGSLAAGALSDKMVARASESGGGMVGARVKVSLQTSPDPLPPPPRPPRRPLDSCTMEYKYK